MPYYVHDKEIERFAERLNDDLYRSDYPAYPTRVDARACCQGGQTVTFSMTTMDWSEVSDRFVSRLNEGLAYRCPWGSLADGQHGQWYAHLRFDTPGFVHYFASEEHAYLDRITKLTPGRYIERFLREYVSPVEEKAYVQEITADNATLKLATTPQEIHRLYNSSAAGFTSCMQRKRGAAEYDWQKHMSDGTISLHPAHVYAAPDLAVAYRGELDAPKQRAVVWPEKKTYQRIYGDGPLKALLARAGYTLHGIEGARVMRVPHPIDGFVMPYVDGVGTASLDEDPRYIVLDNEGPLDCQQTTGSTEDCPPEVEQGECQHCGHVGPYDEMTGELCGSCDDERWRCDHCRATCFADENSGSTLDGESLCESCFDTYESERQEREDAEEQAERDRLAAEQEQADAEQEQENRANDSHV